MTKVGTENKLYPGEISGAYLIGIVEAFGDTNIFDNNQLPFSIEDVKTSEWYPYQYLMDTTDLIEKLLPNSGSILFWAGVRFMELWYFHGPGKEMIHNSIEWVYGNENGEGYNSVARGGTPNEIGWTRNLETNIDEGYALVENVMPLSPDFLKGIYYGGFYLFDDLAYFNTEIDSVTTSPELPFQRTVIKLIFHPQRSKRLPDETDIQAAAKLTPPQITDLLWHHLHLHNISQLRDKYNQEITKMLSNALDMLRNKQKELRELNLKLKKEAITDPLTGLYNKRFFNIEIERVANVAKRNNQRLSIMLIDIDFFKRYNDHYGHLAGDEAITDVANCLKKVFKRGEDLITRFGGEEFLVASTGNEEKDIFDLATSLKVQLEKTQILHEKSKISHYLTLSIGSSISLDNAQIDIQDLIKLADKALYKAKNSGRDQHIHLRSCDL